MRILGWVMVVGALVGTMPCEVRADPGEPLRIQIDKSTVDLKAHRLELKISRPAGKVTIKVYGESGAVLADSETSFEGEPAFAPLVVQWSPSSDESVGKIELYAYDVDGYYTGVALTPWSIVVPHEEVNFARDSSEIAPSEKPKLEASYAKIADALKRHRELGTITLFIAGHTDTVGTAAHNLQLSNRRAFSIARWFQSRGLPIPIAYEGFGESALLVKTADEVNQPRNRRVDYILAVDEPALKATAFRPSWKRLGAEGSAPASGGGSAKKTP